MQAFLRSSEECFHLKPHTTMIGRHEGSDVVLQSAGVADRHAALKFTAWDNSFILQDFNSPQGTFINGCQVQNAAVKVSPGDILRFGAAGAPFQLVVVGAAAQCAPRKQFGSVAQRKPWGCLFIALGSVGGIALMPDPADCCIPGSVCGLILSPSRGTCCKELEQWRACAGVFSCVAERCWDNSRALEVCIQASFKATMAVVFGLVVEGLCINQRTRPQWWFISTVLESSAHQENSSVLIMGLTAQRKRSSLPAKCRMAWAGRLQVVAEPETSTPASPPHLPLLQRQHPSGSLGSWAPRAAGHVPRPPLWKRPVSAWVRSVPTAVPPDTFSRTSALRPVLTSVSSDGAGGAPSPGTREVDFFLQEKGEKLLRPEKEISHLSGLETESKPKDAAVRDLQEEAAPMAVVRDEVELTQKLLAFDRELGAKTEEIKALREQISHLQRDSSQVFSHSLYERDLEIGRLQKESQKLKRDHSLAAGLVASLQREIAGKEQKMQQLEQDVEKMKKEHREKDNQLAVVSAKCSRIQEELKQELGERAVITCRNRIQELERELGGLQREVQKYCAERESLQNQLAEKAKAEDELRDACAQRAVQLQEMGRRERLLRADVGRAKEQLESLKTQVMQVCCPAAAEAAGKAVTEQQVIEKVRQIAEDSHQSCVREKCLQEELSSRLSKEKEVSANVEVLKKSLHELQACLRSSCSSDSLRGELGRLVAVCLDPSISAIAAAVVEAARVPLSWLEGMEQLLASAGMDPCASGKGLLAALERLLEDNRETAQRNQALQAQLERFQESQAALLHEMEAKNEEDLQRKIKQIILEKDKENKELQFREPGYRISSYIDVGGFTSPKYPWWNWKTSGVYALWSCPAGSCRITLGPGETLVSELTVLVQDLVLGKLLRFCKERQVLETAVSKEKAECKQSVEEERKKIRDLESHLRSVTEALERKSKEQEVSDCKLRDATHNLEEATRRETALQQCVTTRDEQLRTAQEENEFQRQKLQEEIVEYKEQSKQHSLTIVALEERLLEAKQQQKALEQENAVLMEKMEGLRGDGCQSTSGARPEVSPATESQGCLREELAVVWSALLSKEAVIAGLTKDLSETRARMSDMRGELSEEQKVELERNRSQLNRQERELNLLREKLSRMSSLVKKKDEALKAAGEELRQAQARCQELKDASRGTLEKLEDAPGTPVQAGEASEREPALDLANLGAKCRGLRHEETIQRQKEGLAELRERIKTLERRQSSAAVKGSETLVLLTKDLPEKIVQKTGLKKECAPMSGPKWKASKVPGHVPNRDPRGDADRVTSSEVADATDLSEKMYLDVIGALGSLMQVRGLSGMQSLKHLPQEEREEVGRQRWKDLDLLYDKIRNLKSCLERREEQLKDYKASIEQLRLKEASLQSCQEEMSRLEEEAYREAEEKALLKEALERMRLQLSQEKRLPRAAKPLQPGAKKPVHSGKLKAKERTAEAVKTRST
ncbi:forkhead-associated domain-containing protein 1 [Rhynochetos jubatus]